jgi:hypothetical protein
VIGPGEHAITDREPCDARAQGENAPRDIPSQDNWKLERPPILSGALERVDRVDAGCGHTGQDFASGNHGVRVVHVLDDFGAAEFVDHRRFHDCAP